MAKLTPIECLAYRLKWNELDLPTYIFPKFAGYAWQQYYADTFIPDYCSRRLQWLDSPYAHTLIKAWMANQDE